MVIWKINERNRNSAIFLCHRKNCPFCYLYLCMQKETLYPHRARIIKCFLSRVSLWIIWALSTFYLCYNELCCKQETHRQFMRTFFWLSQKLFTKYKAVMVLLILVVTYDIYLKPKHLSIVQTILLFIYLINTSWFSPWELHYRYWNYNWMLFLKKFTEYLQIKARFQGGPQKII